MLAQTTFQFNTTVDDKNIGVGFMPKLSCCDGLLDGFKNSILIYCQHTVTQDRSCLKSEELEKNILNTLVKMVPPELIQNLVEIIPLCHR